MLKVKVGDRVKASHPAGHKLLGEVVSIKKRSTDDGPHYCEVKFDHSHKSEWVAIELLHLDRSQSTKLLVEDTIYGHKTSAKRNTSNTLPASIEERVIELGERLPQSIAERDIEPSPLTHVLPPKPGSTIAVSTIYPNAVGWVECKVIKGRNYYYLRGEGITQRYLGSTWAKAIDRLPGFLHIRAGLPF